MPCVVIISASSFQSTLVAGPVGMYLKIQNGKEQYAKIAEVAIGPGHLDRFIVTDKHDMELMKKIRRNIGCSPRDCSIYQIHPRATKEKYSTPAPPEGVETVTSVLNIENVMAFNYLVDNCKIDKSALVDSKEDSERALLVSDSSGRESIRGKVKKLFYAKWRSLGEFFPVSRSVRHLILCFNCHIQQI